jgi:hypothetical protein
VLGERLREADRARRSTFVSMMKDNKRSALSETTERTTDVSGPA